MSGLNDDAGRLHCSENDVRQGHIVTMVSEMVWLNRRVRVTDYAISMHSYHLREVVARTFRNVVKW